MAVDDDVLSVNPGLAIDRKAICGEETPREYLTIDEVRKLIEADAPRADVKIAFLFSCFCGLRLSDVRALQWKKIIEDNGNIHMELRQKKTGRMLYLPLNKQAQAYLPHTKRSAEDYVFSLPCTSTIDLQLKKWAQNAGINKKLTYHTARHINFSYSLKTKNLQRFSA
ncbi:site-specific integrase [Bacteroides uniformis]|uniref:site-specific integrase n=1 Tax=Bacteroides uniformis TaxID=820 RepID=UPI0020CA2C10|nr:site-specific integrase [Bacteroides uniformis]